MRYTCNMAALNIRGFPVSLIKTLKSEAALKGLSLRRYVIHILERRAR